MSPWSIAVGNLGATAARPVEQPPKDAPAPTSKRAATARPICPHCGHPMKRPDGPKPWSPEEDRALVAMFHEGRPRRVIATTLGRPATSIGSRIGTLGLATRAASR